MKILQTMWMLGVLAVVISGCGRHHGMSQGHHDGGYEAGGMKRGMQDMSALVERTVKDPQKATQVNAIMQQIVQQVKESHERSRALHERIYELNTRYDATPEEFTKILDELNNTRMGSAANILGLRFKMKELTTPEEWKALTEEMARYRSQYRHGRGRHHSESYDRPDRTPDAR
jgi:Spy/CpxP family protein refolding chaperone